MIKNLLKLALFAAVIAMATFILVEYTHSVELRAEKLLYYSAEERLLASVLIGETDSVLLERQLAYIREVDEQSSSSDYYTAQQFRLAIAYLSMGRILTKMGDNEQAKDAISKAIVHANSMQSGAVFNEGNILELVKSIPTAAERK